ncbi:leucine-rich repeat extensin-like protein 5 isoform X1 [Papio anubis]|uniref:leucine-rich repeat extensin-like protein 5 isoform X1 n=1 Tax=Papio anubis TaxID=9555 RepID=UPI0012AD4043|nr:leucine-rich repeat extensin-like protein 5 isoform X1 [Papio anubis]
MVPGPNCLMLPASGHAGSIPSGYFIHPDTGRVLPKAGHLGYDLLRATLVPTTDSNAGGVRTSEAAILPYVPYPISPTTGSPPATHLPILQPRRTSPLGALMTDPITGIEVLVLAVTLHPQTRQWLTLGGTYCNPLTKTLAPLEMGGPMEDPVTGGISPILGVGLDENTGLPAALGDVLPCLPPCLAWPPSPLPLSPLRSPCSGLSHKLHPPPSFHPSSSLCLLPPTFPPPFPISTPVPLGSRRDAR